MRVRQPALACAAMAMLTAHGAPARVTKLVVERREALPPARDGAPAYVRLTGHYEGRVDPDAPRNRGITDLAKAPRGADGRVAYRATFAIAMPADATRASGVLLYDVPNRGNGAVSATVEGHIQVISGWQGDIAPQPAVQYLEVPVARALTGPVLQRLMDMPAGTPDIAIVGGIGRPTPRPRPVSLDTRRSRLFHQADDAAAPVDVAPSDWAFADCRTMPFPGTPDPARLCVRGGFDPARAYTLVYEGRDPLVLGLGFAAVRDLNAFLRHERADDAGVPNPLSGLVRHAIISGTSQSGNFVKSFINLDFNAAEDGRRVFDGANPNIAARQVPLNLRFGVPGGAAGLYEPGSEGTLWWSAHHDRRRALGTTSLLARCTESRTCPLIVETFGSAEFWGLRMSPGLIGTDAAADIPLPDIVRRYYFPSVTHGGSARGGWPLAGEPASRGTPPCVLPGNPNPSSDTRRAVLKALIEWVANGRPPPASRYPTLEGEDLVPATAAAMGWPDIPNAPSPTGKLNEMPDYDFGPDFRAADVSGVAGVQPPVIRGMIPQRVPRVNGDGNEVSGVPSVQLLVPLGTYTGWNQRAQGYGAGAGGGCGFFGGFIPFATTRAERLAKGDPRPSLEERYRDHAGFVARVRAVAREQVAARFLLEEDAARVIAEAEASDVLR